MKNLYLLALFLCISGTMFAQGIKVSGTVKSPDGETIPGVNVYQKDKPQKGTTTDLNGKYEISVAGQEAILVFSSVGMATQEITVGNQTSLDVAMKVGIQLDEFVVTALGISKEKKALGYAVSEIKGDEAAGSGEANVIQSLSSKAAGVQVIGSGGTPGSSSKILIRGNATFTGNNQPLIVVDGVPIDNSTNSTVAGDYAFNAGLSGVNNSNRAVDINPDDIASVTVLKGPAAAALYGVRAGNGVIIYTTKRGKSTPGKGVQVTYSTSLDISQVNKLPELQSTYAQGDGGGIAGGTAVYDVADQGPDNIWGNGPTDPFGGGDDVSYGTSSSWGPTLASEGLTAYDNMENFFQNAVSWSNNLSVTGGNESSNFRLSIGDLRQGGVVPNTEFKRTSIRMNTDSKLAEKLMLSTSMSYMKSGGTKAQNGSNLSGVMLGLTRTPASFDLTGGSEDGWLLESGNQHQYFILYDNPYWTINKNPFNDEINRFLGNALLKYDITDRISASYRVGTDFYTDRRKQIFSIWSWDPPETTGQIEENIQRNSEIYSDLIVNMHHPLNENLTGRLMLGNNIYQRNYQDQYSRGRALSIVDFYNISAAAERYADEATENTRTTALFFDAGIDWKSTVFLNVTGRNEWASTFGPGKNNFFYPSVSTSFVFTELIENDNILSFGKIRASYAQVGINPEPYLFSTYYTSPTLTDGFTNGISFPYLGQNGFGTSPTLGDPNLTPELMTGIEIGTDLRFLNGRASLDFTYYNQKTTDILLFRPLPASSGFEEIYTNAGEMVNKGIEVLLSGSPIVKKDFKWNISANYTMNKNEVLKLDDDELVSEIDIETAFSSIHSYAIVGQPYGALYGTQWERNNAGQLIISPSTGLPIVALEEGNIGNPFPDWLAGIRNTFTYKSVNLSFLFDIRKGGDIWNGTHARLNRLGRTEASAAREQTYVIEGVLAEVDASGALIYGSDNTVNATTSTNDIEVDAYDYFTAYLGDAGAALEQSVQDGSWVRLRELSLNYRWDIKDQFVKYLDFTFTGRNLWLATDYTGVDPETSLTGAGSNVTGFDYFNMPGTRSFIFGLKAGF